jgi:hypothetical protein
MTETTSMQPSANAGYGVTRFNALRHGVLSRYTVLPWEDEKEYGEILDALIVEHNPEGPTQEHLVDEIAGVIWRKRRLRLAEAAGYRQGLKSAISSGQRTVGAALAHLDIEKEPATNIAAELAEFERREIQIDRAVELLKADKPRAYEKALGLLSEDIRERWSRRLECKPSSGLLMFDNLESQYTPNAEGLLEFLERETIPSDLARRRETQNRPQIREQIIGEALDADKMEALARYETHLDRKLERMLGMLIRLGELKAAPK